MEVESEIGSEPLHTKPIAQPSRGYQQVRPFYTTAADCPDKLSFQQVDSVLVGGTSHSELLSAGLDAPMAPGWGPAESLSRNQKDHGGRVWPEVRLQHDSSIRTDYEYEYMQCRSASQRSGAI
jgi:hypothetical protein